MDIRQAAMIGGDRLNVCRKWMTLVGAFLLCTAAGFGWYYGNLYIYVISFILRHQAASPYVLSQWTISIYFISLTVGYLASGAALRYARKRIILFAGILFSTGGIILSNFTINVSMTALNVTLGFLHGLGNGFMNTVGLQFTAEWAGNRVGLLLAVVQSGYNVGAMAANQFLTIYINPAQATPDELVEGFRFFSQDSVVNKVPSALFILGCAYLVICVVGFLLIKEKVTPQERSTSSTSTYDSTGLREERARPETVADDSIALLDHKTDCAGSSDSEFPPGGSVLQAPKESNAKDLTRWEMLKTKEYYLVLVGFIAAELLFFVVVNYYKVYGQLYIQDDYFLTSIGTLTSVIAMSSKIAWGYIMDKFGVKICMVILLSISPLVLSFYFFTPMLSKWLFMVSTLVLNGSTSAFSVYGGIMAHLFGKSHLAENFSTLTVASVILSLGLPSAIEEIILHIGWFGLFCFPAVLCIFELIAVILVLPNGI